MSSLIRRLSESADLLRNYLNEVHDYEENQWFKAPEQEYLLYQCQQKRLQLIELDKKGKVKFQIDKHQNTKLQQQGNRATMNIELSIVVHVLVF